MRNANGTLFSQLAQDCDLKVGRILWVAGHSGPETADDSRTHFGIFETAVTQLFPEDGYVKARPTGGEDWPLAEGTNQIIEHVLGTARRQRVLYQWLKDSFVVGTGVVFGDWEFEEDFEIVRTIIEVGGFSLSTFDRVKKAIADDIRLENVDIMDFYPVTGADSFADLRGAARRVELAADDVRALVREAAPDHGWVSCRLSLRGKRIYRAGPRRTSVDLLTNDRGRGSGCLGWHTSHIK